MQGCKFLSTIVAGLLFLISLSGYCFGEELRVTMLDVGQADAILVQTAGKRVLIDAGEKSTQARSLLQAKGITNIDLIVATHPHSDHIGGMKSVVDDINFKVYMDNGFPYTSSTYTKLMEAVESKAARGEARYLKARQGQRLNFGPEAHFEVLWPDDVGFKNTRSDPNANSVVLKLTHQNVCFAFMGDAEAETEAKVAQAIGSCQVLKVSHHGSHYSSTELLLNALQPKIALISAGLGNKHGHPGPSVIEGFAKRGTQVYRTDLMGEVTVISDGTNYRVVTEHEPYRMVKLNVNLAGLNALKELPGIGDRTAQAIIDYRMSNGPYRTIEEVYNAVPRDKKRIDKIMPHITVEGGSSTGIVEKPSSIAAPQNTTYGFQQPTAQIVNTSNVPVAPAAPPSTENDQAPKSVVNINTASEAELAAMPGMNLSKAKAAIADRIANGAFKSCEDIDRVRGIGPATVEKLLPACTVGDNSSAAPAPVAAAPTPAPAPQAAPTAGVVNINAASEAELAAMPGMNFSKAKAAIADRNANGPFKSCEDIDRVNGIGSATVEKLLPACTVGDTAAAAPTPAPVTAAPAPQAAPTVGIVNINTASEAELAAMPGMNFSKAKAAIADRNANGAFKSCEDIDRVNGIGPATVEKLLPACTVGDTATAAPTPAPVAAEPTPQAAPTGGVVNINTASEAELAAMPGMNLSKAKAAIADRNANGAFKSCKDIDRVRGIGPATVEKLLSVCTVE